MTVRLLVLVTVLVTTAFSLRVLTTTDRVPPRQPLTDVPEQLGEWTGVNEPNLDADTRSALAADDYLSRTYTRAVGDPAQLLVAYYASQRQGDTIHSPLNCLPGSGWQVVSAERRTMPDRDKTAEINQDVVQNGREKRLVVYWFQSHGRTIASEYWNKAYLVLDGLRIHRTDGALVRVMTPLREGDTRAEGAALDFIHALTPVLGRFLPE